MAKQTINTGTAPNDGTGDTLKTSFTKANANFTELYALRISNINIVKFDTAGNSNYVPSANLVLAISELVGAGGGGGGSGDSTGGVFAPASGGSGGYSRRVLTPAMIGASINVTVGAGGNGSNAGGTGVTGGQTYIGASFATAICAANGGGGGAGSTLLPQPGGTGGSVTGAVGDVVIPGNAGVGGITTITASGNYAYCGNSGAGSFFGGGGRGPSTVAGASAIGGAGSTGGGGSGAYSDETTTVRNGGKGGDGFVLITEYIAAP